MGRSSMTVWELRAFGHFAAATTELDAWLNFFELRGRLINGQAFMGMITAHKRAGIVAKEVRI